MKKIEKILFYKDALLPSGWAKNVMIRIDGSGTILSVKSNSKAKNIKLSQNILLPGMTNLHSHCHQKAIAGLSEYSGSLSNNFWEWREIMYHYAAQLQPTHLTAIAEYVYLEMLKAGYTSVAEFQYLHHNTSGSSYPIESEMSLAIVAAAKRAGIALTILPVIYKYSNFGATPAKKSQHRFTSNIETFSKICSQLQSKVEGSELIKFGIAIHSLRAIDKVSMINVLDGLSYNKLPIHIHIAEQKKKLMTALTGLVNAP